MPTKKTPIDPLFDMLNQQATRALEKAGDDARTADRLMRDRIVRFMALWSYLVTAAQLVGADASYKASYLHNGTPPQELTITGMANGAEARVFLAEISRNNPEWITTGICGCDVPYGVKADGAVTASLTDVDNDTINVTIRYSAPTE